MPAPPLPQNEAERLTILRSYAVLDTASDALLDEIVALAATLTGCPIALVSLVDAERQWFKARYGFGLSETPRESAFCAHAILDPDHPLIVADATQDPRFADSPLVTGPDAIRSYLGVPLLSAEGLPLGTLCVLDRAPLHHTDRMVATVTTLAQSVAVNLELRRALLRTRELALTDALTGLPNRRKVLDVLAQLAADRQVATVISIDLDHFKEVNDAEGHEAGDTLLRAAARRLRAVVRGGDVVARVGGDEFVVVLQGVDDAAYAARLAERIGVALHLPVDHGTKSLRLGATLGVAILSADQPDPDVVLRVSDEALRRAKQEARGSVGWARPGDADTLRRAATIVRAFDEHDALARIGPSVPGAEVYLQPICRLPGTDGGQAPEVIAVEALARWRHPSTGEVPPCELLPVIGPDRAARLCESVRALALEAYAGLRAAGLAGARVSLNLSASEVAQPDIALRVADRVEAAGLSLHDIEIEITEEVLLDRVSDRTLDQLAALRGRGARLVLDDFGTGNSGLAQLMRLPLDGVKLDKRFVHGLGRDARAEAIVRATLLMANGLNLTVVAEGVETPRQVAELRKLGCHAAQGYLLGRPMPLAELTAWLRDRALRDAPEVLLWRAPQARIAGG